MWKDWSLDYYMSKKRNKTKVQRSKGKFNKRAYYVNDDAIILDDESDYEEGDCLFLVEKDVPKTDLSNILSSKTVKIVTALNARRDIN